MDFMKLKATLSLDQSEYESGLSSAEQKGQGFGSKAKAAFKGVGVAITAITTATAAVGGAFAAMTKSVADYGDSVDKMSQKVGLSTDAYQKWDYVMKISGTEMSSMTTGLKTLTNKLDDAKNGSAKSQEMFAKLGLSMDDLAGMSREEVFAATIKGFQGMGESAERAALANDLFGRSGQELAPLFNTSAEDTEKLMENMEALGGVMSEESVKASAAYQDSLTTLTMALDGVKRGVISSFLPSITSVMDGITSLFGGDSGGVNQINEGVTQFVDKLSAVIPKVLSVGGSIVGALGNAIIQNLPVLLDAGVKAILQIVAGLTQAIPELIPVVVEVVMMLAQTMVENLPLIVETALNLGIAIAEGILDALPVLLESLGELLDALSAAFSKIDWKGLGSKALRAVMSGMRRVGPQIVSAVKGIVRSLLKLLGLDGAVDKVSKVFGDIKTKITSKLDDAKKKVTGWIDDIKGLFPFNLGKIFSGWFPKIKLGVSKSENSAETTSSTSKVDFAKAMSQPYVFRERTEFDAGEAGDEVLFGRSALLHDMAEAVKGAGGDIIINLNYNAGDDANDMLRDIAVGVRRYRMAGVI